MRKTGCVPGGFNMADVFLQRDICRILHNKYIIFIGSSVERSMYKDFVKLLQGNVLLSDLELRKKGERCFHGDQLLEGGVLQGLSNGTQYREVREYRTDYVLLRFYFVTRCYNDYVESIIGGFDKGPSPDLIVMSSTLWDITRYGANSIPQFKSDIETVFSRLSSSLSISCLFLWLTCLPVSEFAKGGVFIPEVEYLRNLTRIETQLADYHCAQLASSFGFDVLDLCYFLRDHLHRRALDGIHWDMSAHRRITNLVLTHVSQAWGLPLPGVAVSEKGQENRGELGVLTNSTNLCEDRHDRQPLKNTELIPGDERKLRKIKCRNPKFTPLKEVHTNTDLPEIKQYSDLKQITNDFDKENVEHFFKSSRKPVGRLNKHNLKRDAVYEGIETLRRGASESNNKALKNNDDLAYLIPSGRIRNLNRKETHDGQIRFKETEEYLNSKDTPQLFQKYHPQERTSSKIINKDWDLRQRQGLLNVANNSKWTLDYIDRPNTDFIEEKSGSNRSKQDSSSFDLRNSLRRAGLTEPEEAKEQPFWAKHQRLNESGNSWDHDPYLEEINSTDDERDFPSPDKSCWVSDVKQERSYSPPHTRDIDVCSQDIRSNNSPDHFTYMNNLDQKYGFKTPKRCEEANKPRGGMYTTDLWRSPGLPSHRGTTFNQDSVSETKRDLRDYLKHLNEDAPANHQIELQSEFKACSDRLDFKCDTKAKKDLTDRLERDHLRNRMRTSETSRTTNPKDRRIRDSHRDRNLDDSVDDSVYKSVTRLTKKYDWDFEQGHNDTKNLARNGIEWLRPKSFQDENQVPSENNFIKMSAPKDERSYSRERHSSANVRLQQNDRYDQPDTAHELLDAHIDFTVRQGSCIPNPAAISTRGFPNSARNTLNSYQPTRPDLTRSSASYSDDMLKTKRMRRQIPRLSTPRIDTASKGKSFGSVVDDVMEAIHSRNSTKPDNDKAWQRQNFNISVPNRIVFVVGNDRGWNSPSMSKGGQLRGLPSAMRSRLKNIEIEKSYPDDIAEHSDSYLDFGRDRSAEGTLWMEDYRR